MKLKIWFSFFSCYRYRKLP